MTESERTLFERVEALMDAAERDRYAAKVELHRIINQHGSDAIRRLYDIAISEVSA